MRRFWSDPLATRRSRLLSFFLLYVSEGLPAGFTVTAVATQMRRLGLTTGEIGSFAAMLWIPWAVKWAFGPFVDTFAPRRFGPRRFWIVLAQGLMALTLLAAMPLDFAQQLSLFTAFLFVHNVFAATQDVAIDALAVNVLPPEERGVANGFMYGGFAIGQGLGGGGVLFLASVMPFRFTWLFVAGAVLAVGLLVSWRIREPWARGGTAGEGARPGGAARALAAAGRRLADFVREAWSAFTGTRAAWLGVVLALLPMGATALGLALQSSLAVDLGLDDRQVGTLSLVTSLLGAICCVVGGWISDRFGRLRSVAAFIVLMSLPTAALGLALAAAGFGPPGNSAAVGAAVPAAAVPAFWACALLFAAFNGLMFGAGTALYMDITTPRVAATQFTAYMALCNVAYAYSAKWQGHAAERLGYPATLGLDAAVGLVCLIVLPFVAAPRRRATDAVGLAPPSGTGPGTAIPEGVAP
jgi:PAT family beta-lactamase induction signal transducer AmpG